MKWLTEQAKSLMFASATTIIGVIGFTASPTLASTLHEGWYYAVVALGAFSLLLGMTKMRRCQKPS